MNHQTSPDANDDILPEYDFSRGVRGKHYRAYRKGTNVVFLDSDVALAFADSASVNQALRLLIRLAKDGVPARGRRKEPVQRTSARTPTKSTRARR